MGLDCFWKNAQGQTAQVDREFKVCGGLFSDNGTTSFRGKVYNELVELASGVSLYQDEINNDTCRKISDCLDNFDLNNYKSSWFVIEPEDFENLKEMFRFHTSLGHYLVGWW